MSELIPITPARMRPGSGTGSVATDSGQQHAGMTELSRPSIEEVLS
ncbi:hypothetical protein KO481_24225 [Nocardia sp. NEAU-G5]|uniref:FXSXX-COOH protein n=1 Tax=Nocardia albiluteola TaxID=2842303 RepID=A0ABS6B2V3_9NOCA|nr:hypothetical protein [Nocardia albiluteola]MBU3064625.1 hypothetical protein [Nocardia albiluteola]